MSGMLLCSQQHNVWQLFIIKWNLQSPSEETTPYFKFVLSRWGENDFYVKMKAYFQVCVCVQLLSSEKEDKEFFEKQKKKHPTGVFNKIF